MQTYLFFQRSSLNMKGTILRYPVKTVSKGMKQRVELNRYLGYRRQPQRHGLTAKTFLYNFELKVVRKASFYNFVVYSKWIWSSEKNVFTNILNTIFFRYSNYCTHQESRDSMHSSKRDVCYINTLCK